MVFRMVKAIKTMRFRPFRWLGEFAVVLFYVLFNIRPEAVTLNIISGPIELKTKKDIELTNKKV